MTSHRIVVVLFILGSVAGLYALQDLLWSSEAKPTTLAGQIWSWTSVVWLVSVVPSAVALAGLLSFRSPRDNRAPTIPQLVSFRIVSRGTHRETLERTVQRIRVEMWRQPLFRYVIEVVTDVPVDIDAAHDVVAYVVPPDYETRRGSRFKARALHYALEQSQLPDDSWIVHLDEETQPTPSGIRGIARMIEEEERTGQLRVGQGAILYHRHWTRHPLLTLADMQRTGDDHARFHVQQRLGRTLFGLHGSFIVVRNDIEKSIGFDFGPEGSVTEDSWWALVLTSAGHRTRWVDGYLEEQSCRSYEDLVRQRRRWFVGLWLVARHAPVKRRHSAALTASVLIWTVAPLSALYTIARLLITSYYVPPWLRLLADVSFAIHLTVNLIGLRVNLAEEGRLSRPMRLLAYATLIVLFPFYLLLECAGVVYGMFDRDYGFHVVEK